MSAYPSPRFLNITVDGTAAIAGAATLSSTISVTGAATLAGLTATTIAGTTGAFSGNFAVATNKFTVAAASGNTAILGTLVTTGSGTFGGLTTAKTLNIDSGDYTLTGAYAAATAPWDFTIDSVAPPADLSTAPTASPRALNRWAITRDTGVVYTNSTRARFGNLIGYDIGANVGVAGGVVADSWAGARVLVKQSQAIRNHPREYLNSTYAPTANALINDWVEQSWSFSFGGTAPFTGASRGRGQGRYTKGAFFGGTALTGGSNFTSYTMQESEYYFSGRASVRRATGYRMSILRMDGAAPPEGFGAYAGTRATAETPGWSVMFQQGVDARMGVDPYIGDFVAARANWVERLPRMRRGLDISDVTFGKEAIRWPGGHISGGERDADGQGTLRVGTLYAKPTSTGVTLDASGYVGQAVNYAFTGGNLSGALNVTINQTAPLFEDDYGGLYRGVLSSDRRSLTSLITLIPPVADGSAGAPSTSVTVRMRDEFGATLRFAVTGTASTTSIPTKLSITTDDYFSDNGPWLLEFLTGAATGEARAVTAYSAATGTLTTAAFSVSPTTTVNLVTNSNFSSAFPTTANTILNGWQWTVNGGSGTVTASGGVCTITGDGTNAADLDQQITVVAATVYYILVTHIGEFTLKVGTSRGGTEMVNTVVAYSDPDDEYITSEIPFTAITGTANLRFENTSASPIYLNLVRCAETTEALTTGVQAVLRVPAATITQAWAARSALSIQPTGGPIKLEGVQASTSYANDAAAAAGGVGVGQVYRNGSVVQVRIV
tara:strand:- start:353 stop:2689 length:2337 start_codon:yes stop_codon:yes gene_type:complete